MTLVFNEIRSTWKNWHRQYRAALTPIPYNPGRNSRRLNQVGSFLSGSLDFCFWVIAGLLLTLSLMLSTTNFIWSATFFLAALVVSPIIPIHWIAKLGIAALASFPFPSAIHLTGGLILLWGFWILLPKREP